MLDLIKKIWEYGWARKGFVKLVMAMGLAGLSALLFNITGGGIFYYAMYVFLGYIGVFAIVSFISAWIVWPITEIVKKIKKKKKE